MPPRMRLSPVLKIIIGIFLFSTIITLLLPSSEEVMRETEAKSKYENQFNEKKRESCDWCGGAGKVGYGGKSEEQYRRTGMGKGNECTECNGSGYKN